MSDSHIFRIASEAWEFEQIHRLNYETFVEEIPQHHANSQKILVDKFDTENTYIICIQARTLLGMLAVRDKRPFSLDNKLDDLDSYLPGDTSLCEVRLLAVQKDVRRTRIIPGLLETATHYCLRKNYDLALISGLLKQQRLYEHLGFVPFGPLVGNDTAPFQPMYLSLEAHRTSKAVVRRSITTITPNDTVNLMPGPVELTSRIQNAFNQPAISHRSAEFQDLLRDTKQRLCDLTGARFVELFMGSGTLANDVIAAQLSLNRGPGLILSNGEFGKRLIDQARRFNLHFKTLSLDWGTPFVQRMIENKIEQIPNIRWLWTVHCETSTGMMNDTSLLKQVCTSRGIRLCLDCVSSIGTVPVDLSNVTLASGVSGKGLRSYSGLSMVFYNHSLSSSNGKLPAYLDLHTYAHKQGIPYTICSNQVAALREALTQNNMAQRTKTVGELSSALKKGLASIGILPLVSQGLNNPFVITIPLDNRYRSQDVGDELKKRGFLLSYESAYLLKRNWIQACLMSHYTHDCLTSLVRSLQEILRIEKQSNDLPTRSKPVYVVG
jgi:aspartate aminotransferase-like enzyme